MILMRTYHLCRYYTNKGLERNITKTVHLQIACVVLEWALGGRRSSMRRIAANASLVAGIAIVRFDHIISGYLNCFILFYEILSYNFRER